MSFEFIEAKVKKSEQFYLELTSDNAKSPLAQAVLPYKEPEICDQYEDLVEAPDLLLEWIGSCSAADQLSFLRTRAQILRFDSRIREIVGAKNIQYGTGKTKLCAEICFSKRLQRPVLFLWLTLPNSWKDSRKAERAGRLRLWLHEGELTYVGHVVTGLGKMRLEEEWNATPKKRWPRQSLLNNLSHRSHIPVGVAGYVRIASGIESSTDYLEICVSIALQRWFEKL